MLLESCFCYPPRFIQDKSLYLNGQKSYDRRVRSQTKQVKIHRAVASVNSPVKVINIHLRHLPSIDYRQKNDSIDRTEYQQRLVVKQNLHRVAVKIAFNIHTIFHTNY